MNPKQITRAILGIAIALGVSSFTTGTKEALATTEVLATIDEVEQPHGYMIANYTIHDQATFKKYMEAAGTLAPKYNGKVIIYDVKARTLEGNPKSIMAVAEFPSVAEAERFYNSPEYTAARKFRIASTEGSVVLAEGIPQAATVSTTAQAKGYMIANYTIKDQETFKKYMEAAGPLAPKFKGKVIICDVKPRTLEGRTGLHLDQVWPMEYSKAVTIPTLVAQVHDDFLTKPSNVQEIYDNISAKDKKLFWIEGTDQRFEGYNYFGKHPKLMLEWFDTHM